MQTLSAKTRQFRLSPVHPPLKVGAYKPDQSLLLPTPQCYEVFKLTEHATTTARPSSIATLAQMHYTASAAKAYITAGSDASMSEKGKSAGIAFQVGMTIERNATMLTEVIAKESFHVQVENIDDAEGIGVLVAMDWIRLNMVQILQKIADVHAVLQLPIALHFDRCCLVKTLPQCEEFKFLRASLVAFVRDFLLENVDFLRENADFFARKRVDQLDQDKCVVLHWERRESDYMRAIDEKAKRAREKDVLPLMFFLKKDIIDILNRNHKFCVESTQISQHQQKPEESDTPQEKLATEESCMEFFNLNELD